MPSVLRHVPRPEARAVFISVGVGVSLLCIKFLAYFLTQSAAIFSDAVESVANVLASGVAMYSLSLAHLPADAEHPYGHGKVEFISAWFEGGMVLLAAIFIFIKTIDSLARGQYLNQARIDWGLLLVAGAMLANGGAGVFLIRTGRRHESMTLEADGKHLLSDAYTSLAVLVALAVVKLTGWRWADPVAALLMAGYITWMAVDVLAHASAGLMDKRDIEDDRTLRQLLDSHTGSEGQVPRICGYGQIKLRHSGRWHWVEFDVLVPATLSVSQGHEIATALEDEIQRALGHAKATAHLEPCTHETCSLAQRSAGVHA